VVGAGPAGISAAIWAKRMGWEPVIFERSRYLGGQLIDFSLPIVDLPGLPEILAPELVERLRKQLHDLNISVEYGCQVVSFTGQRLVLADGGEIASSRMIYAPGVRRRKLEAEGVDGLADTSTSQILASAQPRDRVLVVGGGDRAVEAASRLAEANIPTVLVHWRSVLRARSSFQKRLRMSGADVRMPSRVCAVRPTEGERVRVEIQGPLGVESFDVSHVLVRIGMEPDLTPDLARAFTQMPHRVRLIGDAAEPICDRSLVVAFASGMRAIKALVLEADSDMTTDPNEV